MKIGSLLEISASSGESLVHNAWFVVLVELLKLPCV